MKGEIKLLLFKLIYLKWIKNQSTNQLMNAWNRFLILNPDKYHSLIDWLIVCVLSSHTGMQAFFSFNTMLKQKRFTFMNMWAQRIFVY